MDGFDLVRTAMPESLDAVVNLLVPELQARGVFKTACREETLREKRFSGRGAQSADSHPAPVSAGSSGETSWRGISRTRLVPRAAHPVIADGWRVSAAEVLDVQVRWSGLVCGGHEGGEFAPEALRLLVERAAPAPLEHRRDGVRA